jgi:hypothetical protein
MISKSLLSILTLVVVVPIPAQSNQRAAIEIGSRRQVFIDRLFLEQTRGVELKVHQPRKTGEPTIQADRPWERGGLGPYSCVLKDGDKYHMWYHAMDAKLWHTSPVAGSICYATSNDGITWEKPNLGIIVRRQSR